MPTQWLLASRGDPLGAVRRLLEAIWRRGQLDGLLVPSAEAQPDAAPTTLADPSGLAAVSPFRPVMPSSVARFVPETRRARPAARLGVLVRPCEMRALVEMTRRGTCRLDGLVTVSVDCLATLPVEDYARLAGTDARPDPGDEAVRFARQGGISPYRFRPACQMCASPAAEHADVNVGILGVEARRHLLVSARDEEVAAALDLAAMCDGPAPAVVLEGRADVVARLTERHARTRERLERGVERMPADGADVAERLDRCGPACQRCLDACPICAVEPLTRRADGKWDQADVTRWLAGCTSCGMCEQLCPSHYPLAAMFGHVHDRIATSAGAAPS